MCVPVLNWIKQNRKQSQELDGGSYRHHLGIRIQLELKPSSAPGLSSYMNQYIFLRQSELRLCRSSLKESLLL